MRSAAGFTKVVTPSFNPQTTGKDGRYAWAVDNGCWYVHAEAPFYQQKTTAVVGAPPTLADANLQLKTYHIYMPFVGKDGDAAQTQGNDFVGEISLSPAKTNFNAGESVEITVVLKNTGAVDEDELINVSVDPIWVDLYINPSETPAKPNTGWAEVCAMDPCYGITWYVEQPPRPGQEIELKSTSSSYNAEFTNWPGSFASGTSDLYLYVDSWNRSADGSEQNDNGAVSETNETNNSDELRISVQ